MLFNELFLNTGIAKDVVDVIFQYYFVDFYNIRLIDYNPTADMNVTESWYIKYIYFVYQNNIEHIDKKKYLKQLLTPESKNYFLVQWLLQHDVEKLLVYKYNRDHQCNNNIYELDDDTKSHRYFITLLCYIQCA